MRAAGVEMAQVRAGTLVELDGGVTLQALHPPTPPMIGTSSDVNNNSIVLLLRYRDATALFTGDIEREAEFALLDARAPVDVDVLKAAHQGSATSSHPQFLAAASPLVAVVSVGENNQYGHPSPAVIAALAAASPNGVFTTAQSGAVTLRTDGESWWLETAR